VGKVLSPTETVIREKMESATARALRVQRGVQALATLAGRPDLVAEALAGDFLPWLLSNVNGMVLYHQEINGLFGQLARERHYDWQPALLERGVYA
jgi:ribosomal protein L17